MQKYKNRGQELKIEHKRESTLVKNSSKVKARKLNYLENLGITIPRQRNRKQQILSLGNTLDSISRTYNLDHKRHEVVENLEDLDEYSGLHVKSQNELVDNHKTRNTDDNIDNENTEEDDKTG